MRGRSLVIVLLCILAATSIGRAQTPTFENKDIRYFRPEYTLSFWLGWYYGQNIRGKDIVNRYIQEDQAIKAEELVIKQMEKVNKKVFAELEKDSALSQSTIDDIFLVAANASLWQAQVQGDDFYILAKRFATGTRINREVVDDLRERYIKWLQNPTVKNLEKYSDELLLMGRSYEVLCKVKLKVDPNIEGDKLVKYRTISTDSRERAVPRNSMEKVVPVGNYFVWLEDAEGARSQKTFAFHCTPREKTIRIEKGIDHTGN